MGLSSLLIGIVVIALLYLWRKIINPLRKMLHTYSRISRLRTTGTRITATVTEIGPYEHRTYPEQTYRLSVQWQQPQTKETFTYGTLIDPGFDIVRVRLISRNGVVMEERVQDGLLLF